MKHFRSVLHRHVIPASIVAIACLFFISCSDNSTGSDPGGDTTSPEVTLTTSEQIVRTDSELILTATATDNVGVTKVSFFDGAVELGSKTQAPFEHRINLTDANNGMHSYKAVAEDAAGNSAESAVHAVTVYINAQVGFVNGTFETSADGWALHNFDPWSGWTDQAGNPPGCMQLNEFGTSEVDPGVTQVVTGLMAGITFSISGEYRPYVAYIGNPSAESFIVTVDSTVVGSFARGPAGLDWSTFTVNFVATSETHTIGFFAEHLDDSSYELDNVVLDLAP